MFRKKDCITASISTVEALPITLNLCKPSRYALDRSPHRAASLLHKLLLSAPCHPWPDRSSISDIHKVIRTAAPARALARLNTQQAQIFQLFLIKALNLNHIIKNHL